MGYQEELQARLNAVRLESPSQTSYKLDTVALEQQLVNEIETELRLSQYDLDESDILRSIKILDILNQYPGAFNHHKALTVLYVLAKTEVIQARNLFKLTGTSIQEFREIINAMAKYRLLFANENKEIEITAKGMSLAERIGFDVFV